MDASALLSATASAASANAAASQAGASTAALLNVAANTLSTPGAAETICISRFDQHAKSLLQLLAAKFPRDSGLRDLLAAFERGGDAAGPSPSRGSFICRIASDICARMDALQPAIDARDMEALVRVCEAAWPDLLQPLRLCDKYDRLAAAQVTAVWALIRTLSAQAASVALFSAMPAEALGVISDTMKTAATTTATATAAGGAGSAPSSGALPAMVGTLMSSFMRGSDGGGAASSKTSSGGRRNRMSGAAASIMGNGDMSKAQGTIDALRHMMNNIPNEAQVLGPDGGAALKRLLGKLSGGLKDSGAGMDALQGDTSVKKDMEVIIPGIAGLLDVMETSDAGSGDSDDGDDEDEERRRRLAQAMLQESLD